MYRADDGGASISGELYAIPIETLLRVIEGEPPGLYRGPVELIDGRVVPGILFDEATAKTHPEITALGGWREYLGSKSDVSKS
jgi:AGZA family xanthine/uracil permease-like MFS transporter